MAKGTVQIDVTATTTKASSAIQKLQSQVEKTGGGLGSLKEVGNLVPGFKSLESSIGGIQNAIGMIGPAGAAIGAVGASIGYVAKSMNEVVERGIEAQKEFEKTNITLQTLDRNIGGAGRNMSELTNYLQLISANGVNSMEDLSGAASSLMVAFGGNIGKTKELINTFDDLAAGTGVQVSDWASMAAEVTLTGVSIKDLTRLSNRGIPIYQALGQAMGVTAEEAESMAKKGQVSTENWFDAVENLRQSYKGLSKELSSNTLEGAQATFDASRKLKDQAAGAGYSDSRKRYLNAMSQEFQEDAQNPAMQAMNYEIGKVKGNLENLGDTLSTTGDKLITFASVIGGWLQGKSIETQNEERTAEYTKRMAREEKLNVAGAYKNRKNLTSGQIQDIINTISSDKWGAFRGENGGLSEEWLAKKKELKELMEVAAEKEAKEAQYNAAQQKKDQMLGAAMKYGTPEQQLKAASGRNGIPIILDEGEIEGVINNMKKSLLEGTAEDPAQTEANIKILEDIQKGFDRITQEAARKEQELADARKKSADAALNAKIAEDKAYIEGKAKIGEQITDAQGDYDTITKQLERVQQARQVIADEEAHGIFRKKWGNLNVSEVSTKEAELLNEQKEAGKKLEELKNQYNNYDKNWNQARTHLNTFLTNVVSGMHVPVKNLITTAG